MAGTTTTESYYGSGTIYIQLRGVANAPLLPIGNCSKLTLETAEESKEQANYQGGGGTINKLTRIKSVAAKITADSLSPANLAIALRGTATEEDDVTEIAGEGHADIVKGSLLLTTRLPDLTKPLVVKKGGAPIAEDGNYERRRAGIFILADAAGLTAGDDITIDYTPLAEATIEALTESGKEYRLVFDGLNEAASGAPVVVEAYRNQFSPAKSLDLIADNFGNLNLEATLLADESIVGTGKSKYFKVRKGRLAA